MPHNIIINYIRRVNSKLLKEVLSWREGKTDAL